MSRRYCSVCGELLPDGKKFCLNCGTKYQEPKKTRLAQTEPITLISFPEDDKDDAVVIEPKTPIAEETPEEAAVPAVEEATVKEEDPAAETPAEEEKPEETVPAEKQEEEPSAEAKDMFINMFPDLTEEAEPEEEPGTEELPVIDDEEAITPNIHLNDLIADTGSNPQVDDRYEIPTFPKRSSGGTEILEGTPIDTGVTTRMYERPNTNPVQDEPEEPENEEDVDNEEDYYDDEEEDSGNTKILIGVLVVLLCLVLGAFAYLWFARPELLGRSKSSNTAEKTSETAVPDSTAEETADASSSSAEETADASEAESTDTEETVELGNTVDLTKPAATVDSALTSGDPVSVPDVDADAVIGYATINVETLLVFEDHTVSSTALGHARITANYEVIDKYDDGEYTWYEIAEDMWVPDSNGQWITYQAK